MATLARFNVESAIFTENSDTGYRGFKLTLSKNGEFLPYTLNVSMEEVIAKFNAQMINTGELLDQTVYQLVKSMSIVGDVRVKKVGQDFMPNEFTMVEAPDSTPENPKYKRIDPSLINVPQKVSRDGIYVSREGLSFDVDFRTYLELKTLQEATYGKASVERVSKKAQMASKSRTLKLETPPFDESDNSDESDSSDKKEPVLSKRASKKASKKK